MDHTLIKRFFEPIIATKFEDRPADYTQLSYIPQILNSIGDILPHNSYIIDYHKQNFFFISKDSIFLCGYTEEEVMELAYGFYEKIIPPEDMPRLFEINEAGFDFFYKVDHNKQQSGSISYDLVFKKKDGSQFCVNHKLKPFLFGPDGNIWMAVCCLRPSHNKKLGNVKCYFSDTQQRLSYSFEDKQWHELESIELSKTELTIISETEKGSLEKQIAALLNCTRSNIRYHKSQIMKKTKTDSFKASVNFLMANGII